MHQHQRNEIVTSMEQAEYLLVSSSTRKNIFSYVLQEKLQCVEALSAKLHKETLEILSEALS